MRVNLSFHANRVLWLSSLAITVLALSFWAAKPHSGQKHSIGHKHISNLNNLPQEGGQAIYAAIIEVVALMEKDPETDWSKVNIDRLRTHLMDMNYLILDTEATTVVAADDEIQFDVLGNEESTPSVHRMIQAHSQFIAQKRGWTVEPKLYENGATVTIIVEDSSEIKRLKALGFYGFMSLDSHHQAHHYQIALGRSH